MLNVRLYTYRNVEHKRSDGNCCDFYLGTQCRSDCDNIFTFCLQGENDDQNCSLGRNSFHNFRDSINFPSDDSSILSFSSHESWPVSFKNLLFFFLNAEKFNGFHAGFSITVCENC